MECDCSICRMAGFLHWIVDERQVAIHARLDSLATYRWGSGEARHYFCRFCGIAPLRRPRQAPERYCVNVRCFEDARTETLIITPYPGRNLM
nr:GFA family protein [Larsenimonas salina]